MCSDRPSLPTSQPPYLPPHITHTGFPLTLCNLNLLFFLPSHSLWYIGLYPLTPQFYFKVYSCVYSILVPNTTLSHYHHSFHYIHLLSSCSSIITTAIPLPYPIHTTTTSLVLTTSRQLIILYPNLPSTFLPLLCQNESSLPLPSPIFKTFIINWLVLPHFPSQCSTQPTCSYYVKNIYV